MRRVSSTSTWISGGTEQQQELGAWWLSRQGPYRGRVGGPSLVIDVMTIWDKPQWGEGSGTRSGRTIHI